MLVPWGVTLHQRNDSVRVSPRLPSGYRVINHGDGRSISRSTELQRLLYSMRVNLTVRHERIVPSNRAKGLVPLDGRGRENVGKPSRGKDREGRMALATGCSLAKNGSCRAGDLTCCRPGGQAPWRGGEVVPWRGDYQASEAVFPARAGLSRSADEVCASGGSFFFI